MASSATPIRAPSAASPTCTPCRATTAACCCARAWRRYKGDTGKRDQFYGAMEAAVIDSPRGRWRMGKAHNPVQDIYLRTVANGENRIIGVAAKALEDSGAGCKLA